MSMRCAQKGFTLVELAMVLTIVGLLIGGILKGREMIENARVTSTIAQVASYSAAASAFYDLFNVMPGDMPNAVDRIAGCTAACNAVAVTADDRVIGDPDWASATSWPTQMTGPLNGAAPTDVGDETQLFWVHLVKMNMIAGVTDAPLHAGRPLAWGESHPSSRLGGGFVAGYSGGATPPGAINPGPTGGLAGTVLVLHQSITAGLATTSNTQPLTPARAAQIDRRMDDGLPHSGAVRAYGVTASCYNTVANPRYTEAVANKDCGLVFRIFTPPAP